MLWEKSRMVLKQCGFEFSWSYFSCCGLVLHAQLGGFGKGSMCVCATMNDSWQKEIPTCGKTENPSMQREPIMISW